MIRCPKCGHEFAHSGKRICGRCKRQILRGDKWRIDGSTIMHRNCKDPQSYEAEKGTK